MPARCSASCSRKLDDDAQRRADAAAARRDAKAHRSELDGRLRRLAEQQPAATSIPCTVIRARSRGAKFTSFCGGTLLINRQS